MQLSVILSTYESPAWLEKALWGYAVQSRSDFELLIADDGSGPETGRLLEQVRAETGLEIRHLWQEDRGFRKCAILNAAIRAAAGDYLIFSDGDCIPRRDFVAVHAAHAEPGRFLSGGRVRLSRALSEALTRAEVQGGRAFEPGWLRSRGFGGRGALKLRARGRAAVWLDRVTPTRASWNGHNASGWARDLRAAGGYDERMGYGGLDRELGERLCNAGIRGRQLRFEAICLHLDHPRGYVDPAAIARNEAIRAQTRREGRTTTPTGLSLD